jgi:hypothetical protein
VEARRLLWESMMPRNDASELTLEHKTLNCSDLAGIPVYSPTAYSGGQQETCDDLLTESQPQILRRPVATFSKLELIPFLCYKKRLKSLELKYFETTVIGFLSLSAKLIKCQNYQSPQINNSNKIVI